MNLKTNQKQSITIKQKFNLKAKIQLSEILRLPENKYSRLIKEIESSDIFKKLLFISSGNQKIIRYRRFPRTFFSLNFLEFKEEIRINNDSVDIESLIVKQKEAVALIKKIGIDKFEKYFLYDGVEKTVEEISLICGISEKNTKKIINLINELSVHSEFYYPSNINNNSKIHYNKIAKIESDDAGDFVINIFSPKFIQGKYIINYAELEKLKDQGYFTIDELNEIKKLVKKLELINSRKSTVYQIINKITNNQKKYLMSGDEMDLVPYTQKELAKEIEIDDSLVSRAIYGRSVETPQNAEKALQFFFPSKKDIRKKMIKKIIENEGIYLTDGKIKDILKEKVEMNISRRTVAVCRKELGILAYDERKERLQ